jgi:hypothetical protein
MTNLKMSESLFWSYAKPFLVGSLSGSVASSVIQPIDTIKVIIQSKRESAGKAAVNLSPFHVGRELIEKNGVLGTSLLTQDSTRDSTRPFCGSSYTAASGWGCSRSSRTA